MNDTNDTNDTYDLWKLLGEYKVIVPVIQRDYAQGRKDKKYIRQMFLKQIHNCLTGEDSDFLTLDFVYGNTSGDCFYPIDGQQRLTTLWLIYWYIALKSGNLSDENNRKKLKKFFYETRSSSTDFCNVLCERFSELPDTAEASNIVDFIKSKTWFFSSWLQDPTISAMLRTIGGDGDSSDDNIVSVFSDIDFKKCWNDITDPGKNKVRFELKVIGSEKLPVSDDLYIKMNARGKPLTSFENFKADLVSWMQSKENPDREKYKEYNKDKSNNTDYNPYFPARIDNLWTDLFWKSAKDDLGDRFEGKIDDAFFAFINRFVVNEICLKSGMNDYEFAQGKEKEENKIEKNFFNHLYGIDPNNSYAGDGHITYEGFDAYKRYLTFDTIKTLDEMFELLNKDHYQVFNVINDTLDFQSVDEDENSYSAEKRKNSLIPKYAINSNKPELLSATQKERIYFLSIYLFIKNTNGDNLFDTDKFKKWIRVVRNIVENADIRNVQRMVQCMRKINKLAVEMKNHNNDVYNTLKSYSFELPDNEIDNQIKEEAEKATKILSDENMEKSIIEAEKYAFFNGTIRFLYRNGKGSVDWDNFKEKFKNAKVYFKDNSISLDTVKAFLSLFKDFSEINEKHLFSSIGYDHKIKENWKRILCDKDLQEKVHELLINSNNNSKDDCEDEYKTFLNSGLIDFIYKKSENYKYRCKSIWYKADNNKWKNDIWEIHKKNNHSGESVYVYSNRINKYKELKSYSDNGNVIIDENQYINGYYWGEKIRIKYNGKCYIWYVSVEKGKVREKICKVENNKESENRLTWEGNDLLYVIDPFDFGVQND